MHRPGAAILEGVIPELLVLQDAGALAREAAARFESAAGDAVRARGRFAVALAGGTTPRGLYALLAGGGDPPFRERVPWGATHVFFGDERAVPPDHPDSNYRMASETLLSRVPIPAENVRRIPAERPDPRAAAEEYERTIRAFFAPPPGVTPRFDLVLLGLGTDGHTASLFPGGAAIRETTRLVAAERTGRSDTWRITLTLPILNASACVMFLVSGGAKAAALRAVLRGPEHAAESAAEAEPPARLVRPGDGRLIFLADPAAARLS